MEANAQALQDALGERVPVYLGREWLIKQPELPHAVFVPTDEALSAPTPAPGVRASELLADDALSVDVVCRAATFEDARALALLCWSSLRAQGAAPAATIRYGGEEWGGVPIRVATLSLTLPALLTRDDLTRVRVEEIVARHHLPTPTPSQEVPRDPTDQTYRDEFRDGADPVP